MIIVNLLTVQIPDFRLMNWIAQSEMQAVSDVDIAKCYHCGDQNPSDPILHDHKAFCCQGCKLVFTVLSENGLTQFYRLNNAAGISLKNKKRTKFEFLDDPDIIAQILSFKDDHQARVVLEIPQIHCSSCVWLLENLYKIEPAVLQSRVNYLNKELSLSFDHNLIHLRRIAELLASLGYEPTIRLEKLENQSAKPVDKSLYYKLGLAGFAFGNIMLFSFPEYLGMTQTDGHNLNHFFSYLNIVLILPVIFYSASGYFKSAYQGLKNGFLNIDVPVSLGIVALFGRSLYEILSHSGAGYLDSLAGLIFFLLIGKWFQQVGYSRIRFDRDYRSYFPIACSVITEVGEVQKSLDKLRVGDVAIIRNEEMIPADSILLEGDARIDYSFVTGESDPVKIALNNILYAGGKQKGEIIKIAVKKNVQSSYLTGLWNEHNKEPGAGDAAISELASTVAKYFTIGILAIAFITLMYWLPRDGGTAINAFTAVLIIACPCAVALSIPFTFGNVIRIFSRTGIYFKNAEIVEKLSRINHIVFDKTGTLTSVNENRIEYKGTLLTDDEKLLINSTVRQSSHPVSRQIRKLLFAKDHLEPDEFKEVVGMGISAIIKNRKIRIGSNKFIDPSLCDFTVLSSDVLLEIDGIIRGVFRKNAPFREGLEGLIKRLQGRYSLSLISGDNESDRVKLEKIFPDKTPLYFECKPKDKLDYIKSLKKKGAKVAMIGDGLNDAGAFKESDVGIVVSEDTANFTPACEIILNASRFSKLPDIIDSARHACRMVIFAYLIAAIYNIVGLTFAVQGLLSPLIAAILMPLSSLTIVLIALTTTTIYIKRKGLYSHISDDQDQSLS